MTFRQKLFRCGFALGTLCFAALPAWTSGNDTLQEGDLKATMTATGAGGLRTYTLSSNANSRENGLSAVRVEYAESPGYATVRTGNTLFDGLYALAVHEAQQNAVSQISDGAYGNGKPIALEAFQTGQYWTYVWTRDLSYATDLGLAGFDSARARNVLLFKTSALKPTVSGGVGEQVIQDTGSGGSYPVSTDRIVWSLGAARLARHLPEAEKMAFVRQAYPILKNTLEQDRHLVFDMADGLYRGEQSFLDWREQTYPLWTANNVLPIALSKALSTNCAYYAALQTVSEFAGHLGETADQKRYARQAADLKQAINRHFYDTDAGLYSTYLLAGEGGTVRVSRYDLLGESLAVSLGIAPEAWAKRVVRRYPTGPYGPPVVWPQERRVPIYHNHAIWPFVTAYWIKAARAVGNADAVDSGMASLMRGAAFNGSNMENLDVVSGRAHVGTGSLQGPVINSPRQIWSVAGYLSLVQDIVFGLDTSWDGIRFQPFVTDHMRNEIFGDSSVIEMRDFRYQGKRVTVRVHLPQGKMAAGTVCTVARMSRDGKTIGAGYVRADSLPATSTWDVFLSAPKTAKAPSSLRRFTGDETIFAPIQPEWEDAGKDITLANNRLTLHFHPGDDKDDKKIVYNIYRDGKPCARNVTATTWTDPNSGSYASRTAFYQIEAIDPATGNASHLTPTRAYTGVNAALVLPASQMQNRGGNLVDAHHFENWGQPADELRVPQFTVPRSGRYLVRAEYSNGAGSISSGITCAVKRLEISPGTDQNLAGSGYLILPQLGDWKRFAFSSWIPVNLKAGQTYSLRISEDAYSRNMSYLAKNERYTAANGGGEKPYNYVNIAAVHLIPVADMTRK